MKGRSGTVGSAMTLSLSPVSVIIPATDFRISTHNLHWTTKKMKQKHTDYVFQNTQAFWAGAGSTNPKNHSQRLRVSWMGLLTFFQTRIPASGSVLYNSFFCDFFTQVNQSCTTSYKTNRLGSKCKGLKEEMQLSKLLFMYIYNWAKQKCNYFFWPW